MKFAFLVGGFILSGVTFLVAQAAPDATAVGASTWTAKEWSELGGLAALLIFSLSLLRYVSKQSTKHQEVIESILSDNRDERAIDRAKIDAVCKTHHKIQEESASTVRHMVERCSGTLARREAEETQP